jgi:hypothetical protein
VLDQAARKLISTTFTVSGKICHSNIALGKKGNVKRHMKVTFQVKVNYVREK